MLSKINRLNARAAGFVIRRGRGINGKYFRVKWALARGQISRATVVAGLAMDKRAVKRNLVKRRVREILRPILPRLIPAVYLMVFANKGAVGATFQEVKDELFFLLKKARIL